MKQDKDWIDVMRSTLRDAETPPPADGWVRLERELGVAPAPRVPAWRIHWPRIAAAAAAIVICVAAGEYLWRVDPNLRGSDGDVITEAVRDRPAADTILSAMVGPGSAQEPVLAANTPASVVNTSAPRSVPTAVGRRSKAVVALSDVPAADSATPLDAPSGQTETRSETQTAKSATGANTETGHSAKRASEQSARQSAAQTSRRTVYDRDFVAYAPPRKKASFSLYGGGGVTGGSATGVSTRMQYSMFDSPLGSGSSNASIGLMKQFDYARGSFQHHQPLSFGLSVRKEFAHGLSLESGVNYTLLRSDVSLFAGSKEIDQKLHFIGVPLRMNWQFLERGRFSLYVGAGGMVEKCVSARFDGMSAEEPVVQWSLLGAAGAQYRLGGTVALYFEPEVSYYFTETELRTSRTDSPLTLTLRMGVRLSF